VGLDFLIKRIGIRRIRIIRNKELELNLEKKRK
jgi:hypothetical protein